MVGLDDIRACAARIDGAVVRTPQARSRTLSKVTGADVTVKFENLQFTASFKERGALNTLLSLDSAARSRGVIAMSAGNHAQGVAYHAERLGIPATIVMPLHTPNVKVAHTRAFGAEVILHGETLSEASEFAHRHGAAEGLVFVHPYDDERVIAGTGTIGLEMLADDADLEVLVVPIGGGGLIAGIAIAAKALKPDISVVGVQSALYPSMARLLRGEPTDAGSAATIAEGIAVKQPGALTSAIVRDLVDDILLVEEDALERAIGLLLNIEKTVVEGAGAAGLAALLSEPDRFAGRRVGIPLCGGNIDSRLLAAVLLRDLVRDGRIGRMRVAITDTPGALARVAAIVGEGGGNIIDVAHHRVFAHLSVKQADLELAVETRDAEQFAAIEAALREAGFPVRKLDDGA